jgi:ribonuclease BN (tRNA processing enzyme)
MNLRLIFCLKCKFWPKSINAELLSSEYKIKPGPIFKRLIDGESIVSPDGRVITPQMVILPSRPSRKIVILGDTFDPAAIAPHAMDADVLVHEATCTNEDLSIAISKAHSTAGMAGAFAKRIRAKNLILNHFSPRGFEASVCKLFSFFATFVIYYLFALLLMFCINTLKKN